MPKLSPIRQSGEILYRVGKKLLVLDAVEVVILETEPAGRQVPSAEAFEFRLCRAGEVRNMARDPASDLTLEMADTLADRLASDKDFCFAAFAQGQLAGYAWFALDSIEAEHNSSGDVRTGVAISFPRDVAFMYKGYVLPNFRGKGLYGNLLLLGRRALADYGVRRILSTYEWTNAAAGNAVEKIGFQKLGKCYRYGVGQWMFTRPPRLPKELGIQFGNQADEPNRRNKSTFNSFGQASTMR